MPRLSRKLRVCKWIGTVGCVLVAGAFVFSEWWWCDYCYASKEYYVAVGIDDRAVGLAYGLPGQPGSVFPGWLAGPAVHPECADLQRSWARLPSTSPYDDPSHHAVDLPLWLPFVVLLLPTLLLWRRDRRRPRPGCCPQCDYDLTGNTSGVCPECGHEIAKPDGVSIRAGSD